MGIGLGIFLIALGAILTFAVDWTVAGLDLHVVGKVLMVAGVVGLILFFVFWNRRREPETVATVRRRQVTDEPRTYDNPTPPPTATTVTPQPQPPAQVTTVTATAPVVTAARSGRESG